MDQHGAMIAALQGEPTLEQRNDSLKNDAHRAVEAAEKAWYAYAADCELGDERICAFAVYENVRTLRRVSIISVSRKPRAKRKEHDCRQTANYSNFSRHARSRGSVGDDESGFR